MKLVIILIYAAVTLFDLFLKLLNYRHRNAPIPANVRDVYDEETYKKRMAYDMENLRLDIASRLVTLAVFVVVMAMNWHSAFFYAIEPHIGNVYIQAFLLFALLNIIEIPSDIIFGAIKTFKIEAKYGFNKASVGTFIADFVKDLILIFVLMLGGLSLFMVLHGWLGNWVFVVFIGVLVLIGLIAALFSRFILRLAYKLTPLEDGALKDRIMKFASEMDFPVKSIFIANASKRSTKVNAGFAGLGKFKTIILFDTLLENYAEDEILSILAHEVGHAKKKHSLRKRPMNIIQDSVMMLVAFFVVNSDGLSYAFGFTELNIAFSIVVLFSVISLINLPLNTVKNIISRKFEYEADDFAVKHVGVEPSVSMMKKGAGDNFANLTPHPLLVAMTYSHPPITDRVANMEKTGKKVTK